MSEEASETFKLYISEQMVLQPPVMRFIFKALAAQESFAEL